MAGEKDSLLETSSRRWSKTFQELIDWSADTKRAKEKEGGGRVRSRFLLGERERKESPPKDLQVLHDT